jgi:hypothetical protein
MIARNLLLLLVLVACSAPLVGQEIKVIDLTGVQQRTELRFPPAPPIKCEADAPCADSGWSSASVGDGAPDRRDPHALGIELLSVRPFDIDPTLPFDAEFRVLNTGLVPIELPVSPHLSDLQPSDPSVDFSYFSLALVTMVSVEPYVEVRSFGFVNLYGSRDHQETMITLKPGEWIRVKANVKLQKWPSEPVSARIRGEFWLRNNIFHPHPGGGSTATRNLYPNITPSDHATWLHVNFIRPSEQQDAKP